MVSLNSQQMYGNACRPFSEHSPLLHSQLSHTAAKQLNAAILGPLFEHQDASVCLVYSKRTQPPQAGVLAKVAHI